MLALMDNSDMELSDSDSEPDVAESDSPASSNEGDGTDSDSEDDVPLARVRAPAPKRRVMWKKTDDFTPVIVPQPDCVDLSVNHQQWSPVRYFEQYVDDNDFSAMADYTNRHFLQGTGRVLSTSTTEMKKFVGISMMMGCIGMKRIRMYWQRATRINSVADCMQRDRFSKLRNHFTVVDNNLFSDDAKAADRMWKVRPFMDRIRRTCLSLPREANVSIDEQMVSFTGRCPSRQYVPRKPNPTGLKNFVLAGSSGLVLDFEMYQGAGTFDKYEIDGKKAGQGSGAVLRLCETLSNGHRLYCDRFFTTVPLIKHMLTKGIYVTGTITKRFLPVTFTDDRAMAKMGRGTSEQFVSALDDVSVVKWFDNKSILLASSVHGKEPQDDCRRWCKKQKTHLVVRRPAVIAMYNKYMGGVDMCDRMISYHRMETRTRRWNFRVIAHFIDLALSNCWIQARQEHPTSTMQLYDFRLAIALTLMRCESTDSSSDSDPEDAPIARSRTTPLPAIASRVSSAKHLPVACDMKNAARCRREGCKAKTRVKCEKCDMFLCVSAANNCFKAFHTR